jgi:hypothetical protein
MAYYFDDLFARENFASKDMEKSENGIAFAPVMYNKLAKFALDPSGGNVNIVSDILQSIGSDRLPVHYGGSEI